MPLPFEPQDPAFEQRVRDSYARQRLLVLMGASLERVAPGEVDIRLPFRPDLAQQHGFMHAGAMTSVVDTACGYAALTLMSPDAAVLSVEFKVNLLAPGEGRGGRRPRPRAQERADAQRGARRRLRGRRGEEKLVATMLATMMAVRGRGLSG